MTLLQEGNFKEIFKTDEGNFVQNEEKLSAKQEILCCKSGNPAADLVLLLATRASCKWPSLLTQFSIYNIA